jgi:hypothetical protein
LERALKDKHGDRYRGALIMAQASKLIAAYTSEGFDSLLPMEAQLQRSLARGIRIMRRILIHKILSAKEWDPKYRDYLNRVDDRDADTKEDWDAVVACIDEGKDLLWNLRSRDPFEYEHWRRRRPRLVR